MPRSPSSLRVCAGLVALEAMGLFAVAGFFVVEVLVATPDDRTRALVAALLALVTAAAMAMVARGLGAGRRWARAPALVVNLLVLPVAVDLVRGGRWYVGLPLVALALGVLALLFARGTDTALED